MTDARLVMAVRQSPTDWEPEAEPVVLLLAAGRLIVTLDDGETISMDAAEVFSVFSPARQREAA